MPRRRDVPKREILPDPKYHSELLAKFINHVMLNGKRSVAEKIVYGALDIVLERTKKKDANAEDGDADGGSDSGTGSSTSSPAVQLLDEALDNVRPTVEVRSRRVGGATYQVPVEVRETRRDALAMRWIVDIARHRGEKGMVLRLANEILDALNNRGSAVKKREDMHKMAKANQAFAHFRWT